MSDWQPDLYSRFEAYRTRPACDLLARVPLNDLEYVVDLGCGPGNSTGLLAKRWPKARITGVDSSASMLECASKRHPQFTWIKADLGQFQPDSPADLFFANATLLLTESDTHFSAAALIARHPGIPKLTPRVLEE